MWLARVQNRVAVNGSVEGLTTDRQVEMAIRHRQLECRAPLEACQQAIENHSRNSIDLDRLGAMNPAATELSDELRRVFDRIDCDTRRCFARFVQSIGVGRADVYPRLQRSGEIADGDRRRIGLGKPFAERNALSVLETLGEYTRREVLVGLRRMLCDAKRERLVHIAVDVGQLNVEVVDRCRQSHEPCRLE